MGDYPGAVYSVLGGDRVVRERSMKMTNEQKKLTEDNVGLAHMVAWSFRKWGDHIMDLEDLRGYALVGLAKAATTYDSTKGAKFSTYAVAVMANEIRCALRRHRKTGEEISLNKEILRPEGRQITPTLADVVPCLEDGFDRVEDIAFVSAMMELRSLSDKERRSIAGTVLLRRTQKEVARELGVTQSAVSLYVKSGVQKMRAVYNQERKHRSAGRGIGCGGGRN